MVGVEQARQRMNIFTETLDMIDVFMNPARDTPARPVHDVYSQLFPLLYKVHRFKNRGPVVVSDGTSPTVQSELSRAKSWLFPLPHQPLCRFSHE